MFDVIYGVCCMLVTMCGRLGTSWYWVLVLRGGPNRAFRCLGANVPASTYRNRTHGVKIPRRQNERSLTLGSDDIA